VNAILTSKWTKAALFAICLIPFGLLVWQAAFHADLIANPAQFFEHATGDWTLRFLAITLAITPLRKILRVPQLIRFRRMLGLFAFFYVCLHLASYLWIDKYFDWRGIWADLHKRTYIIVGFSAFVLLIPLALTSTAGWIRRLGGKRWRALHRAIYASAVLGVIHYWWLVKSDISKPVEYAVIVGGLLAWRIGAWVRGRKRQLPAPGASREPAPARMP